MNLAVGGPEQTPGAILYFETASELLSKEDRQFLIRISSHEMEVVLATSALNTRQLNRAKKEAWVRLALRGHLLCSEGLIAKPELKEFSQ